MYLHAGALKRATRSFISASLMIALTLPIVPAQAQVLPQQLDPATLQRLQRQLGSELPGGAVMDPLDASRANAEQRRRQQQNIFPQGMSIAGVSPANETERAHYYQPSAIEREYRERLGLDSLQQFGYALFNSTRALTDELTGEVPNDYILGIGDELIITMQGATNLSHSVKVNREGQVIFGSLPPIRAAGRTLGSVRAEIASTTQQTVLGTNAYTSVGAVHAITVFVGGEVNRPGQYQLTSMSDVASALAQADGVRRTGSLRRVRVVRHGQTISVDLYGLLGIGTPRSVRLQDGDRVIVPVIGDTVAVAGGVAREGIYELRDRATISNVLDYAGGAVRPRGSSVSISRINPDGSEGFIKVTGVNQAIVAGDALIVAGGSAGGTLNRVTLRGHVLNQGPRPLPAAPTVRDLLGSASDLRSDTYQAMAVIIRRDPGSGGRTFKGVNLALALSGGDPVPLQANDALWVLSNKDIDFLNSATVRQIALGQPNLLPQCKSLQEFANTVRDTHSARFSVVLRGSYVVDRNGSAEVVSAGGSSLSAGVREVEGLRGQYDDATFQALQPDAFTQANSQLQEPDYDLCPKSFEEEPDLLPVLIEHAISIGGAIRRPGAYPIAGEVTAATAAAIANGITPQATNITLDVTAATSSAEGMERYALDQEGIALTRVILSPGDDIRFNGAFPQYETAAVILSGELERPGVYTIRKGETLSQLIARAGGMTSMAYPYGTIVTRRSVKQAQEDGFKRTARDLNNALLSITARKSTSGDGIKAASQMISSLSSAEAAGRVVVEADPRVLALRKDLDTMLEGGDAIFVPKQPNFVVVLGDVSNPGAVQFSQGRGVGQYIADAGGTQFSSDNKRIYIVYPNGLAQPVQKSAWRSGHAVIPPGSTIIVPKNLDPLFKLDLVRDIAQVVGSFVTSAASIAILARK